MYGSHRFLISNRLVDAALTVASAAPGIVSGTQKTGTGAASLVAYGNYSGAADTVFVAQIESVSAGAAIGKATYRWRVFGRADGGWDASGVVTHAGYAHLRDGVMMKFVSNGGVDCVVGDQWTFRALALWQADRLLDGDRDTVMRGSGSAVTLTADFGAPVTLPAIALLDHNLTAATGACVIMLNDADIWTAPAVTLTPTVTDPLIVYPTAAAYRYLRVALSDPAQTAVTLGAWYAGDYFELEANADYGSTESLAYFGSASVNEFGVARRRVHAEQRRIELTFSTRREADVAAMKRLFRATQNPATGRSAPFLFHLFADEPDTLMMARLPDSAVLQRAFALYQLHDFRLALEEVVKTRRA